MRFLVIFLFLPLSIYGTTIIPYQDIQTVFSTSTTVVFGRAGGNNNVIISESFKGNPRPSLFIKKWSPENSVVFGDVNLKPGKRYLLFLDHQNKPICLSYYVFEEQGNDLMPIEEASYINAIGASPNRYYPKDSLFNALRGFSRYPNGSPITSLPIVTPPDHCTWLNIGGNNVRFPQMPVAMTYIPDTSMSGCPDYLQDLQIAFDQVDINYEGVDYQFGGVSTFSANCDDGTVLGSDYINHISSNFSSNRNGIIFYSDPCGEITDLTNCAGTLAFGGMYSSGTHTFNGETWTTAGYPFVVVNTGFLNCICDNDDVILLHELTHTFGIGHISSTDGAANMNPFCCNDITNLDIECVDFTYPTCSQTITWTGSISDDWDVAGNWNLGFVPDSCSDVIIPSATSVVIYPSTLGKARTILTDGTFDIQGQIEVRP